MADWLYGGRPPSGASAVEHALADSAPSGPPARARGGLLIPLLQLGCIAVAVMVILRGPPLAGAAAWLLGAIAVPLLWAWFFVEFKRREVASERFSAERKRKKLNHALLLVGLAVGMWGAFVFATEVAK